MTTPTNLFTHALVELAALALIGAGALTACGSDDPIDVAASHVCACEKLREGLTDVAGCEREVAAAITAASDDCAECINTNAGSQTTAVTCDSIDTACADVCGFEAPAGLTGVTQAVDGMCACDALDNPGLDPAACHAEYEALLATKAQACIDCVNAALDLGVDADSCLALDTDCQPDCQ